MTSIYFVAMQAIEEMTVAGNRFDVPAKETFAALESVFRINDGDFFYEIEVEKSDEYVFGSFDFGNPTPRDSSLTNINTGEKRENTRTDTEVELNNQFFFLYCFSNGLLYLSNSTKKKFLVRMFKEKLQKDIILKDIYKNVDDFLDKLQMCTQISFTHVNDLFSNDSVRKQALVDLTGTDAPQRFTLRAKYDVKKKNSSGAIFNFIRTLSKEKESSKISDLVVSGIDDSGFSVVYNTDSFARKIQIDVDKDENGKFKRLEVRDKLLNKIQNNSNN